MDNMITEARKFMSSDEGKDMMDTFKQSGNDPKESDYTPQQGSSGSNSFPSGEAQYGQGVKSENTYSAQNNAGDNDNNDVGNNNAQAAGQDGSKGQEVGGVNKNKGSSDYDGYEQGDSSATGGWGANEGGDSFARANQLGAETKGPFSSDPQSNANGLDNNNNAGGRSGTSTPAYREEDEMDSGRKKTQGGGGSSGLNPYGNNEEDVPSNENNPYHEQGRRV